MGKIITISVDSDLPLISSLQTYIDLWHGHTKRSEDRLEALNLIAELIRVEKNPTEFVATFKLAEQISPEDFIVVNPSIKVNSNTRIREVYQFYKSKMGENYPMQISIIEFQNQK